MYSPVLRNKSIIYIYKKCVCEKSQHQNYNQIKLDNMTKLSFQTTKTHTEFLLKWTDGHTLNNIKSNPFNVFHTS